MADATPPSGPGEISLTRTSCFDHPRSAGLDAELLASAMAEVFAEVQRHHPGGSVERMTHRFIRDQELPGLWQLRTYALVRLRVDNSSTRVGD